MTPQEEQNAKEAEMLLKNATLMQAFNDVRYNALHNLALVPADDMKQIIFLQAKAALIEEVCEELQSMMSVIPQQEQAIA